MQSKTYFPAADHLRGAAILSVLLYHGIIEYPIDLRALYPWCDWLFRMLAAFHMPLFFILAGFVYRCERYGAYLKKRCLRLLVPYAVFGGASVVLHSVGGALVNGAQGLGEGLLSLALYGGEYWFLYSLFVVSAVFPLLDRIKGKWFLPVLIAVTMLLEPVPMTRMFVMNKNIYYLGYFALGVLLRRNVPLLSRAHACIRKRPLLWTLGSAALFLGGFTLLQYALPGFAHRDYLYAALGCASVAVACTAWELPAALGRFLGLCSRYSLQLYLLNGYFLVAGRVLLAQLLGLREPAALILSLFALSLLGGLGVSKWILDRNRLFRALSGIPPQAR